MRWSLTAGLMLLIALVAMPARAQTGFAKGRVVDAEGQPIPDVKVVAVFQGELPKTAEDTTNQKGQYVHAGLYPGRYRFTYEKAGYETVIVEHSVILGNPTEIPDVVLEVEKPPELAAQEATVDLSEELQAKFRQAVDLTNAGQFDEAEALFDELVAVLPDVPEIHQNLGYLYVQRKDWPRAEASYRKALELRPGDAGNMSALARVYQEMGEDEKALEMVREAAGAAPENALAQYNQGVFLINANQIPEAIQSFESALAADPDLVEAHFQLGTLLVGQGRVPEALEHLQTYVAAGPDNEQNVATAKGLIEALGPSQ